MGYDDLKAKLSEYAKKLKSGAATVADHSEIKNHINDAHGAGSINNELKKELGQKATFAWQNRDRAKTASRVVPEILEKGGTIGKFAEAEAPVLGKVIQKAGRGLKSFAPLLGMLGAGTLAMGAGQKAMAGDIPGAAGDIGRALLPPGVEAALPSDLGEGSDKIGLPPTHPLNAAYSGEQLQNKLQESPVAELLPGEPANEKARYSDLQKLLQANKPLKKF